MRGEESCGMDERENKGEGRECLDFSEHMTLPCTVGTLLHLAQHSPSVLGSSSSAGFQMEDVDISNPDFGGGGWVESRRSPYVKTPSLQ